MAVAVLLVLGPSSCGEATGPDVEEPVAVDPAEVLERLGDGDQRLLLERVTTAVTGGPVAFTSTSAEGVVVHGVSQTSATGWTRRIEHADGGVQVESEKLFCFDRVLLPGLHDAQGMPLIPDDESSPWVCDAGGLLTMYHRQQAQPLDPAILLSDLQPAFPAQDPEVQKVDGRPLLRLDVQLRSTNAAVVPGRLWIDAGAEPVRLTHSGVSIDITGLGEEVTPVQVPPPSQRTGYTPWQRVLPLQPGR